jgi:DNA-binding NtrC family response regulator
MIDHSSEISSKSWTKPEHSGGTRDFLSAIQQIAASDFSVLIVGEKGTGKAWAARKIHELSGRSDRSFIYVDCATMDAESIRREFSGSDGTETSSQNTRERLFEKADGGTIFFDQIDALPFATQGEIARLLKSRSLPKTGGSSSAPVDVRFIASLCRKPEPLAKGGVLPTEIYHRMSTIMINLPPLRERREDIPHLIEEFLLQYSHQRSGAVPSISPEALKLCLKYDWPGNIQELKDAIEGAVMICGDGLIQKEHLPVQVQGTPQQHQWNVGP